MVKDKSENNIFQMSKYQVSKIRDVWFFFLSPSFKEESFICVIMKGMTKDFHHITVLLHETVDMLDIKPDGIYVDATLGGAGHSEYLLSKLGSNGHLYAFDQDQTAIDKTQIRLKDYIEKGQVTFIGQFP